MNLLSSIGSAAISRTRKLLFQAGFSAAVLRLMFSPSTWTEPVRNVLARQILFTSVEAVRFTLMTGLVIGVSIGAQLQVWLGKAGQSNLLAPALIAILLREAGPLITNLILIGRSGTATFVHRNGRIVTRSDPEDQYAGTDVRSSMLFTHGVNLGDAGLFEGRSNLDGNRRLIGFHVLQRYRGQRQSLHRLR